MTCSAPVGEVSFTAVLLAATISVLSPTQRAWMSRAGDRIGSEVRSLLGSVS